MQVFVDGEMLSSSPVLIDVTPRLCPLPGQKAGLDGLCYCAAPCAAQSRDRSPDPRAAPKPRLPAFSELPRLPTFATDPPAAQRGVRIPSRDGRWSHRWPCGATALLSAERRTAATEPHCPADRRLPRLPIGAQLGGAAFIVLCTAAIIRRVLRARQRQAWIIPAEKIDLSHSTVLGVGCALCACVRPSLRARRATRARSLAPFPSCCDLSRRWRGLVVSGTFQGGSVALKRMARAPAAARSGPPGRNSSSKVLSTSRRPGSTAIVHSTGAAGRAFPSFSMDRNRRSQTLDPAGADGAQLGPSENSGGNPASLMSAGAMASSRPRSSMVSSQGGQSSATGSATLGGYTDDATSSGGAVEDDVAALFARRRSTERRIGAESGLLAALCDSEPALGSLQEEVRPLATISETCPSFTHRREWSL